ASRIFEIEGVSSVFLGSDFISVTKGDGEWPHLKPAILGAIMEHYLSGDVTMGDENAEGELDEEFFEPEDEEMVNTIKELLDTRVRPAVAQDGGDITFQGYRDGVVFLHMRGACSGCPSSTATLRHGIENLLKHFIPEVQEVRPI
ncbi:MAG: NifU family protein, partial [Pseudomonadota bacterium]